MENTLVLINPWIYDFAAYDLWSKPLGLLYLAGALRACGFNIHLTDCLNVYHPGMRESTGGRGPVRRAFGTGKFWKSPAPKTPALEHIARTYSRYGISKALFEEALKKVESPSAVLVTSLMTYWYPGVQEAIRIVRKVHPDVPVILGGIYASLCRDHALEHSGADLVVSESGLAGVRAMLNALAKLDIRGCTHRFDPHNMPYPAFDLLQKTEYACLLTSVGCPYRCHYCASTFLNSRYVRQTRDRVLDEILHWHKRFGVRDLAFYDDALLVDFDQHLGPVLKTVIQSGLDIRFHTPNALHVKEINTEVARVLYQSGFRTIRLGLESSDMALHEDLDQKIGDGEFEKAVESLRRAGYGKKDLGAYILMGLPGQSVESVRDTVEFVGSIGAVPYLAEYSPIPHTPLWQTALAHTEYDLSGEPLYHNNTLLPCWDEEKRNKVPELKRRVREIRQTRG